MSPRRVPLLIVLTPVAAGLALQIALGLFVVHPPALGWIGLAVATLGLAALIALLFTGLFSDTRANAVRLHPRAGAVHRLLIVVEGKAPRSELHAEVQKRI